MAEALATRSILSVHIAQETDFLLARQRAKQIAELLGFPLQDQTRIATAVSEIARNAYEYGGGGRAEYFVDLYPTPGPSEAASPQLRIVVTDKGKGIQNLDDIWAGSYRSSTGMGLGLTGARRLLDELDLETGPAGTVATLIKRLPRYAPTPPTLAEISTALAQAAPTHTGALSDQNHELLVLLNELRTRESELQNLNEELEETNRGVLVLYAELEDRAQAVQQASEMKTRFLSGVTHELRTPLNSVVSLSRLLLAHTDGELNQEQCRQVQFILRSAQNLTEMVNDLLDLARIEAGKSNLNLSQFTVVELFAAMRGMFRPLALNENVQLIFEIPAEPITLYTDEGKLSQILRNFIANALKFTDRGSVTVSAKPDARSGNIVFAVVDTGIGIAPENHVLVMQEWGQVEEASRNKQKGSGLGLPLSGRLAELLGGRVEFDSAFGVGSTFRVIVPALAASLGSDRSDADADPSAGPPCILIVDDDEVPRYLLRRHLRSFTGAEIVEAHSGREALAAIQHRRPDLVFVDLVMVGGPSGAEVVRQLRIDPATRDLPIALYSSKFLSKHERQSFEALDVTVLSSYADPAVAQSGRDEFRAGIERALLQVGLCNLHDTEAPR